jgi:hypothetical protein
VGGGDFGAQRAAGLSLTRRLRAMFKSPVGFFDFVNNKELKQ